MDAAIAMNAMMGVVSPMMNGIGGDLFAIVYDAKANRLYGLNSSGWAPKALSIEMLRKQAGCGDPHARTTSGLVGYLDGEPVGWVAVEPRISYPKLRSSRVPWRGRAEDKDDPDVWAVTCFVVRKGYRGRGLTYPLAQATIDFARSRGARALEAYPLITQPGKEIPWGDMHVGARQVFEEAGFTEVSHPTLRCVVMRIDFPHGGDSRG